MRSPLRLAVYKNVGATLFQHAIYGGEPKSRTLRAFRSKERLEDSRLRFDIHAHARITDSKHHVVARNDGAVHARKAFVESDVGGFDGQFPALRHGIARVDGKIHNHLIDLSRIGADRSQSGPRHHHEIYVLANHASQHFQILSYDLVHVEHLRSKHLFAAEGEQLPRKRCRALRSIGDLLRGTAQTRIGTQTFQKKFRVSGNHHQQVIKIVGNASGEAPDGFHLLRLS